MRLSQEADFHRRDYGNENMKYPLISLYGSKISALQQQDIESIHIAGDASAPDFGAEINGLAASLTAGLSQWHQI